MPDDVIENDVAIEEVVQPSENSDSGSEADSGSEYSFAIPEGKELAVDISGMSEAAAAAMIADMGDEAFREKEAAAESTEEEEPDATEEVDEDSDSEEVALFLETIGLSKEEYCALPESVQEKLESRYVDGGFSGDAEIRTSYAAAQKNIETLVSDPVIAARLAVLRGEVSPSVEISETDVASVYERISSAETVEQEQAILAEALKSAALKGGESAFTAAGSRISAIQQAEQEKRTGLETILSVGQIDKRLASTVTAEQLAKMDSSSAEFKQFMNSDAGKMVSFLAERGMNYSQINKLGAKAIYAMYAAANGWDQQAIKSTVERERRTFAERLKSPSVARPVNPNPTAGVSTGNMWNGIDIDRMGDSSYVSSLAEQFEGDPQGLSMIRTAEDKYWSMRK